MSAAITAAKPDAIDLSSGVEAEPGRKQVEKVRRLMRAVDACGPIYGDAAETILRRIF